MTQSAGGAQAGERCRWCGSSLPTRPPGPGRPRRYCRQSCRQAAHMARKLASSHGLGDDDLIVSHGAYEQLQGHVYALRAAAADIARDEPSTPAELREALDWLREFVGPVLEVELEPRLTL